MAENGDLHQPATKIPKLSEQAPNSLPFFNVKMLSPNAIFPSRASSLSAGYDLFSVVEVKVPARGKALVPTDLSIAIPKNTYARIHSRSELTWKHSIVVGAGVIDADYRGPVGVILFNRSDLDFEVKPGDCVAQLIILEIITPDASEVDDLDSTSIVLKSQTCQTHLLMAENDDPHEPAAKIPKLSKQAPSSLPFLNVKKLSPKAILPSRASSLSAGYDLSSVAEVKVPARGMALVPTDLSIAVPEDTYPEIAPRSGLTWKHSIDVGAGVIDADYGGPVGVILFNHSDLDFEVKPGDRVAQLIIHKIPKLSEEEPSNLSSFKVKKLSLNAILPSRASSLPAVYVIFSATEVKVPARGEALIPTDLLSSIVPEDTCARIAPRSELTLKHSIDVGDGVIDVEGLVGVILFNHSDLDFEVKHGDHVAQLILHKIITPNISEVDDLDSTARGSAGFGSTGV